MRRVVLVNRFFHPDHSATSQMASDLAFYLAARGWDITVVTGRLAYENAEALPPSEIVDGVRIARIWTTRFGRHHLGGRALDYATFYLSAFFAILRHARRGTVVIAMTDPPLLSVVAAVAVRLRRARLVNWVQDLFPDVAIALGMSIPALARVLRDWSLRSAKTNVVICNGMTSRVPRARVRENWAPATLHPVDVERNELRREWKLPDRFIVGYSGNLGRAHDAATIARAVEELRTSVEVHFLFVGAGAQMSAIRDAAGPNTTFQPYQSVDLLSQSLSAADAHLVALKRETEGLLLPSKLYGVLAVGRPVIFIGDPDGEVARLITGSSAGVVVPDGRGEDLVNAILDLARNPELRAAMGRRGRELYETQFAPSHALGDWERILESVT